MISKLFFALPIIVLFCAMFSVNKFDYFFHKNSVQTPLGGGTTEVCRHRQLGHLPIVGAIGPETVTFDQLGDGPYAGISDGRIIKWQKHEERWIDFAITSQGREGCGDKQSEHICGRPLGMCFSKASGDLYIADAYKGLLKVGPDGGLATVIAAHAQGIPFKFTNALDIHQSHRTVYFTDSTSVYQRRNYISVILSGDRTGRLMKYEQETKQLTVILNNLSFPNGVALSKDGNFLVFAETTNCRILRYWLQTPKAGTLETWAQLPGFPDNVKRSPRGGFWVAMHSRRSRILAWLLSCPRLGSALVRVLPVDITKAYSVLSKFIGRNGLAMRLSEDGEVLETFEYTSGDGLGSMSEVQEKDGELWIGSIDSPFIAKYTI